MMKELKSYRIKDDIVDINIKGSTEEVQYERHYPCRRLRHTTVSIDYGHIEAAASDL